MSQAAETSETFQRACDDARCGYRVRIGGPLNAGLAGWLFQRFPKDTVWEGGDAFGHFVVHIPHTWQPDDEDDA